MTISKSILSFLQEDLAILNISGSSFINGSFAVIDLPCSSFYQWCICYNGYTWFFFINGSFATIDAPGSFVNGSFVSLDFVITYIVDLSNSSAFLLSVELEVLIRYFQSSLHQIRRITSSTNHRAIYNASTLNKYALAHTRSDKGKKPYSFYDICQWLQ